MSDHSESPEVDDAALDTPEDKLSAELGLEEEDSSLLDAGLGDPTAEDADADGDVGALLEESNDSVNIEDPVGQVLMLAHQSVKPRYPNWSALLCLLFLSISVRVCLVSTVTTAQEIEAIKARVKEMEEEAEKLKEMQGEVEKQMMSTKAGKRVLSCRPVLP